jgi:voltage-gated potassium channel
MSPTRFAALDARRRRRELARSLLWVAVTWLVLGAAYFAAPTRVPRDGGTIIATIVGAVIFLAVLGWQLRRIVRAELPELRAVEAVGTLVAVFVVLVAAVYWTMSAINPAEFSEPLNRISAMYLAVATATTVGFGDVSAEGDAARAMVTAQMVLDIVLLASLARAIFTLARMELRGDGETPDGED